MADVSTSNDLNIRPVLFLGFLAASTPTALLIAYRADMNPVWHLSAAHTIIQLSILILNYGAIQPEGEQPRPSGLNGEGKRLRAIAANSQHGARLTR